MTRRIRLAEILLVPITLLVMLPLAEIAVRIFAPQTLPSQEQIRTYVLKGMYVPDAKAGFRPAPNFAGKIERDGVVTEFSLNSLGLRGAELGPKTRPRIAAFGDSFTWGWGCPQGKEWIHVLGQELERLGGPKVQTVNCGVNAYGTGSEAGLLEEIGAKVAPDVVLLGFFANDYTDNLLADLLGAPAPYGVRDGYLFDSFTQQYFRESWLARESHLYRLFSSAWETFRVRYLHGMPSARPLKQFTPAEFQRGLDLSEKQILRMKQIADGLGARFAVVWLPADVYALARTRPEDIPLQTELQRRVAAAGIPSIDLLPVVTAEQRIAGLYLPRDGHFTERGNHVAGRALARWVMDSPDLLGALRK
ncbi:MAG: SGNH/GDSL hydrolase family protein [bacterium]